MGALGHLFDVDAVFALKRGLILAPGVAPGGPAVSAGHTVRLERPDGTAIDVKIQIVERAARKLMFSKELSAAQVPIGTRVFLLTR
jgi:hypothetical protein